MESRSSPWARRGGVGYPQGSPGRPRGPVVSKRKAPEGNCQPPLSSHFRQPTHCCFDRHRARRSHKEAGTRTVAHGSATSANYKRRAPKKGCAPHPPPPRRLSLRAPTATPTGSATPTPSARLRIPAIWARSPPLPLMLTPSATVYDNHENPANPERVCGNDLIARWPRRRPHFGGCPSPAATPPPEANCIRRPGPWPR